ncbi:rhomboid-like protein 19, partial [Asparagus officinalis]|uniref:rhomboid-like protein 19 n=1 Tax=Asparagus officinalis TaxID=4686 RepID=UPI00098E0A45
CTLFISVGTFSPFRTIPFAWNLVTAGYLEQSLPGVAISTVGLLFFGRLLEPLWGPREFLKFIIVVNFLTSICVFATAIGLYYITRQESYLYTPLSGFHGVLSGFLVGIKQITPDDELSILKIKLKWLPTLFVLVSVAISFFLEGSSSYIPTIIFGIYMSWIYLRYFQRKPETGLKGDPSDEFSFSSFFPEFLRPILDPIASVFDRAICGRSVSAGGSGDNALDETHLPGSDPIEALRRRERGARALEQRLAAEKLSSTGSAEGSQLGDAAENV